MVKSVGLPDQLKDGTDSELKHMLNHTLEHFRAIVEGSDDAIISKTINGIITSWNPGATRLFGYSSDEMLDHSLEILLPPDRKNEELFILERIGNGERIDHFETVRIRKDGSPVHVSVTISPLRDNRGKIIGASKIARDITERKEAEEMMIALNNVLEQRVTERTRDLAITNSALRDTNLELLRAQNELVRREKMSALGVLVRGVSHEMNTPLGNSLTVGSSLHDEVRTFEVDVERGKISKNRLMEYNQHLHVGLDILLRNLARAIEQVMQFRHVSVDQSTELRRCFDLKSAVEENIAVILPQFKRPQHQIVVDIPDGLLMDSYPGALGQVVMNLALNSLIHGFSNEMNGLVTIAAKMEGTGRIQLICADNGKGIAREILQRIFDPYFTTRMGQGGNGLGLNIVFNLVTQTLGGTISVDSEVGVRTVFTIDLPMTAP